MNTDLQPAQRPLHDLSRRDILLLLGSLLIIPLPPGPALIGIAALALCHLISHETTQDHLEQLNINRDALTKEHLSTYERVLDSEQAGKLSEKELRDWYVLVGSLIETSPKPLLSLQNWRLDLIGLLLVFNYKIYQLYVLFPTVMNDLFSGRF